MFICVQCHVLNCCVCTLIDSKIFIVRSISGNRGRQINQIVFDIFIAVFFNCSAALVMSYTLTVPTKVRQYIYNKFLITFNWSTSDFWFATIQNKVFQSHQFKTCVLSDDRKSIIRKSKTFLRPPTKSKRNSTAYPTNV